MTGADPLGADWRPVARRQFVEVSHVLIAIGRCDGCGPHVTMCAPPLVIDWR
jgi:hypothetical protein